MNLSPYRIAWSVKNNQEFIKQSMAEAHKPEEQRSRSAMGD